MRVVSLCGAVIAGVFGVATMWSGVNALTLFLFGAALVLLAGAFAGSGSGPSVGLADLLVVALLGFAGAELIAFAARQFRASMRLTDPGDDFIVEAVLAAGGLAAMIVPAWILVRRNRRAARD